MVNKILKCMFPTVLFENTKFLLLIHYTQIRDEINFGGISKDFSMEYNSQIKKN